MCKELGLDLIYTKVQRYLVYGVLQLGQQIKWAHGLSSA
jgi:hypothetical protein